MMESGGVSYLDRRNFVLPMFGVSGGPVVGKRVNSGIVLPRDLLGVNNQS